MPLARDVVRDLAVEHGACIRPVQLRRTDIDTGQVEQVLVPCGHTLASVCPSCAERARMLRAAQCREGWHLDHEPVIEPDPAERRAAGGSTDRAEAQADRDARRTDGHDTAELDELIGELDEQITDAGMRGNVLPAPAAPSPLDPAPAGRPAAAPAHGQRPHGRQDLHRAGRQDVPAVDVRHADLPELRPGRRGRAPADPDAYDYRRAARDALHFAALFDRFIQNLRRFLGYDVQYFAAVEPQRRLAPHIHIAMRGTVSRAELRQVLAATYHQVWWPATDDRPVRRRRPAGLARAHRQLPRPGHRRSPPDLGPGARRHRRPTTSRCTWPGSASGSTPRACWPDRGTPAGASAT